MTSSSVRPLVEPRREEQPLGGPHRPKKLVQVIRLRAKGTIREDSELQQKKRLIDLSSSPARFLSA